MSNKLLQWGLVLVLGLPAVAQATLISRLAGQAYYDDVLDITWLQDANLADSNSFGVGGVIASGRMNWNTANSWITAMNADGGTGYLGFNDWRLPTLSPVSGGATFNVAFSNNGTTDIGYGATDIGWQTSAVPSAFVSEMGYMYYANLANLGSCTPNNASPGLCSVTQPGSGLIRTEPFQNVQKHAYWSEEFAQNRAWIFGFFDGKQDEADKTVQSFAWAVSPGDVGRSGDVAAVPEPGTALLVGAGLLGLMGFKRSTRRGASVI